MMRIRTTIATALLALLLQHAPAALAAAPAALAAACAPAAAPSPCARF